MPIQTGKQQVAKPSFGVPSKSTLAQIEASEKVARLRDAEYSYSIRRRELERQFEAKAHELHEEYLAETISIHGGDEEETE